MNRRSFVKTLKDAAIGTAIAVLPCTAHGSDDFSQYPLADGEERYSGLPTHIIEDFYDGDIDSRSIVRIFGNSFERFKQDHPEYITLDDVRGFEALRPEDAPYTIFIKHRTAPVKFRSFGVRSRKPHEWFQKDPDPHLPGPSIYLLREATDKRYNYKFEGKYQIWYAGSNTERVGILDRDPNPTDNMIIRDNDMTFWTQIDRECLERIPPGPLTLAVLRSGDGKSGLVAYDEPIDLMMENTSGRYNALGLDGALFPDMEPFMIDAQPALDRRKNWSNNLDEVKMVSLWIDTQPVQHRRRDVEFYQELVEPPYEFRFDPNAFDSRELYFHLDANVHIGDIRGIFTVTDSSSDNVAEKSE